MVGNIIDIVSQTGVRKDVMNDLSRIMIPELILGVHPLGCGCVVWADTSIVGGV